MAQYKKRSVKHSKKKIKNAVSRDIEMKPAKRKRASAEKHSAPQTQQSKPKKRTETRPIKVIRGNRPKIKRRRMIVISVIAVIIIAVIVCAALMPTGIVEAVQNFSALSGSGSGYPVTLGGGSISSVLSNSKCYIVSSATDLQGFNADGETVFSYQHGYEIPVIKNSSTRFLLYSQGGTEFSVYNYKKNLCTVQTENPILAANISNSGYYAVATQSDSYASQITVYNDNLKQVYQWFCSDYVINDVLLSDDGKTLAISVFNAQNGVYNSRIYILGYDSATPEKLLEYNGDLAVSLRSYNSKGFFVVFGNKTDFISWKDYSAKNSQFDKNIIFSRGDADNSVIATCRDANLNDNTVYIFGGNGEKIGEFNFGSEITDIEIKGKYIYILSDRKISVYNLKSELIKSADCDFGVEKVVPVGNFKVAVINDNKIQKIVFE